MNDSVPRPGAPRYKVTPQFALLSFLPNMVAMVVSLAVSRALFPHVAREVSGTWAGLIGVQFGLAIARRMETNREAALFFARAAAVNAAVYLAICAAAELAAR